MTVRITTLTDWELVQHVDNLHAPGELIVELARRLGDALEEIEYLGGELQKLEGTNADA